jgi:(p)ppGpp synthase/HD superfamily hydrolase
MNYWKDMERICLDAATEAHKGQKRWSGQPYIVHPLAVALAISNSSPIARCAALLHDVLEDTTFTEKDLIDRGVDRNVVEVVKVLTRKKNQSYADYILSINKGKVDSFYGAEDAIKVKIADLTNNLEDKYSVLKPGHHRDKYELALYILKG